MAVSRCRAWLLMACCLMPLAACASEDETGVSARPPKTGATATPSTTPTPTTSASPTPTPLPSGFDNSGTRPGAFDIAQAEAIGIDHGNNLYVASNPNNGSPFLLTVMSEFGTLLATTSLALMPERFAFLKSGYVYASGNAIVTMNASHSVVATDRYTEGSPAPLALAESFPDSNRNGLISYAVGAGSAVFMAPPSAGRREFPGASYPTRLAFAPAGVLWGIGGTTMAQFNKLDDDGYGPEVSVTDLGDLVDVAFDPDAVTDNGFWVLGTTGLARCNALGNRTAGPFSVISGNRLFVKGGKPVVVSDATGRIVRYNADGTENATITMAGGFKGADMDAGGNLWVSSPTLGKIVHTRF